MILIEACQLFFNCTFDIFVTSVNRASDCAVAFVIPFLLF